MDSYIASKMAELSKTLERRDTGVNLTDPTALLLAMIHNDYYALYPETSK